MDKSDSLTVRKFAVSALLIKDTEKGFNYQLRLDVIVAYDHKEARARYGLQCKDELPDHGLREVLAVEVLNDDD